MNSISEALWTLPGIFAFAVTSWGLTILFSVIARKQIIKKSDGDENKLKILTQRLMAYLLIIFAAFLLFLAYK